LPFVSYRDVRDYAVAYLARCFASRKDLFVAAHPGRFDEAEIRRLFQQTPALLTSLMGLSEDSADDNQKLEFVSWILVRANNKDALFDDALVLLSVLVPLLRGIDASWSKGGADHVEAKNLYTSAGGGINAALWAVSWTWPLRGSVALTQISEETLAEGGILQPSALEAFAGYDAETAVGTGKVPDHIEL
jgi:hypothetical protein